MSAANSKQNATHAQTCSKIPGACRRDVRIVNVARGGLIDRDSVAAALREDRIGGLGLDVQWMEPVPPDDPLLSDSRVIMTPHIAGVTELSYRNMADTVMQECAQLLEKQPPTRWLNQQDIKQGHARFASC